MAERHKWFPSLQIRGVPRRGPGDDAFTLLEVMAALVVLTVAITAFLAAIAQNVQLEAMNAETVTALNCATKTVETIKNMDFADVKSGSISPTFTAEMIGNDGKTIKLTDTAGSEDVGKVTILGTSDPKATVVLVEVTWRSVTGSERFLRLMTEVTDY